MDGSTAQIVALTCHLNARRRGIQSPRFFPDNSTCQFCESIRFLRERRKRFFRAREWHVVAQTPDDWLDSMAADGFSRAVLLHRETKDPQLPDRMSAAFVGGGGRWLLSLERNGRADYWEAGWGPGNRKAADRRIWRVQYALVAERATVSPATVVVDGLVVQLTETLQEIEAFARKHGLDRFADSFSTAQTCLSSDDPFTLVYHRDLAPEGALNLAGARLLACSQAAWVFGGMGSWNDLVFDGDDHDMYESLSDGLFDLLNLAICAGANQTAVGDR